MASEWRKERILEYLANGLTLKEAAANSGIHRQTVLRWRWRSASFAAAVASAMDAGREERTYRLWLRHPFRGRRPPTGKGNGGKPRFTYGRRG